MTETIARRQRRRVLTDRMVATLPRKPTRYFHPDPELPSHGVRVLPDGPSSFYVVARDAFKKQRWVRLGGTAELSIADSRERAREVLKRLRAGLEPFEAPAVKPDTFADVVQVWLARHVRAKGLRTGDELQRVLERHVLPVWATLPFSTIKRSDIARLLDTVEDRHGAWVADAVLSALRSVASFHAARDDSYVLPFVRNMRRVPEHARKRARVLDDVELGKVVTTAEADDGPYGAFILTALFTGQRREKLVTMKWTDLSEDGVWTIPKAPREKNTPATLRLSKACLAVINGLPRFVGSDFVFTGARKDRPLAGFSHRHREFKARCGVDNFSVHDLRRCCRSLLSRAGVQPHIAEKILGHSLGALEATYNRYGFETEMAAALERLAHLIINEIVHPAGGNIVPLHAPGP